MNIWKQLFGGRKKSSIPAPSNQKVKSVAEIFSDVYGPMDKATADKVLDDMHKEMGQKKCDVCGRISCRPGVDGYLESDLAGKPVRLFRAGAKHLAKAQNLSARAYAQVHALSIGPKTQFGRCICHECISDYWGAIEQSDTPTGIPNVIWNE